VTSLRSRLGLGLIISLLVMLTLLWLTVGYSVHLLMENQLAGRLEHDAETLLGGITIASDGTFLLDSRRLQGIYLQPYSGHYYQIEVNGHSTRSRSLWDESLPSQQLALGETRQTFLDGPQQQPLLLWSRAYRKQDHKVIISVAEDMFAIQEGLWRFQWQLLAWGLAVVALLLLLQHYIVVRSLRPVSAAAADIARLEQGEITELHEQVPDEVSPLVRAINMLLQRQQMRLQRSREALGNLAHSLKTPLTVLLQLAAEKIPDADKAAHAQLQDYSRQIDQLVSASLRRARLAGDGLGASRFDLQQDLPVLLDTLSRLHRERTIRVEQEPGNTRLLPLEQQDGMELLGNLLDNAWKWARTTIRLNIVTGRQTDIVVEDDGTGIEADEIDQILQRGGRQDETVAGHGIGLSVVRGMVEELGGSLDIGRSENLGGLRITISLPPLYSHTGADSAPAR
jgi:signal transduction histidine kinase